MKKGILLVCLILGSFFSFSQNEEDVLRYSTTDIFGSARFEAMAGSFGGLGADLSAIQINPASMGRFSSSKTSLSFNYNFLQNSLLFNEEATESNHHKFTISNIGVVFVNDLSHKQSGRRYGQLTLSYNRLKNFSNTRIYEGQEFYSLLDVLADDGYGIDPEFIYDERPFTTGLAYDVYAVDYDLGDERYYSRLTAGDMLHHRRIDTKGGMGEFHVGYSENYKNQFYYGASIGIRRINYKESYTHSEKLLDTVGTSLRSFDYLYEQQTNGTGLNLKLGVLYLPIDELRIGLAFESPTIFRLADEWKANMNALHADGVKSILPEYIPEGKFDYRIKTPMKLRASIAYVFAMRGAINIDVEMNNLPKGLLKPDNIGEPDVYLFSSENDEVSRLYRTTFNTRIGMEYMVYSDIFLRGGFAILPQPYKDGLSLITSPNFTYSIGLGWENRFLAVDLGYRLLQLKSDYYAFDPSKIENRVEMKTISHHIILTAAFKF